MKSSNQITFAGEITLAYKRTNIIYNERVRSSKSAFDFLEEIWPDDINVRERFYALFLNNNNEILGYYEVSTGGLTSTIVDIRLLMTAAIKCLATSIIISHNHPSGADHPSKEDKSITDKIKSAAKLLDIKLLDHIILYNDWYYSFADNLEL